MRVLCIDIELIMVHSVHSYSYSQIWYLNDEQCEVCNVRVAAVRFLEMFRFWVKRINKNCAGSTTHQVITHEVGVDGGGGKVKLCIIFNIYAWLYLYVNVGHRYFSLTRGNRVYYWKFWKMTHLLKRGIHITYVLKCANYHGTIQNL